MSDNEREDLETMVMGAGWERLMRHAEKELGQQMQAHVEQCANIHNDAEALNKLRQVIAAKKAVDILLAWPTQRVQHLREVETSAKLQDMGYLVSRRGGL
jgi:hypothetical protein